VRVFFLDLDGLVENIAIDQVASSQLKMFYPMRYRLPSVIWNKLDTNTERIQRTELFALGSILYELISGNQLFGDIGLEGKDEEEIHSLITRGDFPEDLWTLPMVVRILACWCPAFAKEMLAVHGKGMLVSFALHGWSSLERRLQLTRPSLDSILKLTISYIRQHPILFGL
jgi:hypothetical protein